MSEKLEKYVTIIIIIKKKLWLFVMLNHIQIINSLKRKIKKRDSEDIESSSFLLCFFALHRKTTKYATEV